MNHPDVSWPDGKRFAFTVFDDPDSQTTAAGREVYAFLADLGFRTTKGVWPVRGPREPSDHGQTGDEPDHLEWLLQLQRQGFEIGYHNATLHTSTRGETEAGLARFAELFGHDPRAFAQHYFCDENIYWGDGRVSGAHRHFYNVLTRFKNHDKFSGERSDSPLYWADLCKARVSYVRNFAFGDINTLRMCPFMPYFDPARPMVNAWYAASEGSNVTNFNKTTTERAQDALIEAGGLSIMYTHFGHGYVDGGKLNSRFVQLMTRLARADGWFTPVSTILDFLRDRNRGVRVITDQERQSLERRWLLHKIRYGTA